MGAQQKRRKRIKRREIVLPAPGYQPSKAQLEEEVRLPATPTELARAAMGDVKITRRD